MPKKACCCKTSCCAPYNYTNNVAMLGDLLIEEGYKTNNNGDVETDPSTGEPILDPKLGVYPIHPDDELILFQIPGPGGIYGGGGEQDTFSPGGCRCCYGQSVLYPQRTRTVRQKYKNIGCSWTWYPPKYAIDGNPTIPQCNTSGYRNLDTNELAAASDCFLYRLFPGLVQGDSPSRSYLKCDSCAQILPYTTQVKEKGTNGSDNFDIWGDTNSFSDKGIPQIGRVRFVQSGWLTQYASFIYPGHPTSIGYDCCSCWLEPQTTPGPNLTTPDVSCWNKVSNGLDSDSQCANLENYRTLQQGIQPLRTPRTSTGNIFFSPLQGRTNSVKNPTTINLNQAFEMGKNTELGSAYFINENLVNSLYTPSNGGYKQNECNYCASSPYLRRLMKTSYPWAFDIFCAGGDVDSAAKTYDIGQSYVKTNLGDYNLYEYDGLHNENLGFFDSEPSDYLFQMEQYKEMLGESTFYSQFIGTIHLEHYFHYMGTNLADVEAAGNTIPKQIGFAANNNGTSQSPKDRWGYWLTRTTPKIFTFKSSGTPLFQFDLVYADRLGIFKSFADPDRRDEETMTIEKFLSYFSMFSNAAMGTALPDIRGKGMYPPGCGGGNKYVQIIRDILGAMCEAGIIGTRDHRENIYNEIKQIIETGIANGRNGAYYKPWAPGNPITVTPTDFDKLYNKYYVPNMRICTQTEMFPEEGLEGLSKFGPVRKVIPPSLLSWEGWQADEDIPSGVVYMYKEHPVDPDDIFNEGPSSLWNCKTGGLEESTTPLYKIQDLQFSKYYNNGSYSETAPGYVNRQLFFRAIPGEWKFVKWGSLCLNAEDCEQCLGSTPCSPFYLYGEGPDSTFNPENIWHSSSILTGYYAKSLPDGSSEDPRHNGILALCSGIARDSQGDDGCGNDYNRGQGNIALDEGCGSLGICWDPTGAPTTVRCIPDCSTTEDGLCALSDPPCGRECSAGLGCSNFVTSLIDNSTQSSQQSFIQSAKLCKDLYGDVCCECIGKSPNDIITEEEWVDILFGQEKKCAKCSEECFVGCPEVDIPPNFSFIPGGPGGPGGGPGGGEGGGGGGGGGGCLPCDTAPGCAQLARTPCDPNCGYNGFEFHPLCVVMSSSNYSYGRDHILQAGTIEGLGNDVICSFCECSATNYCYARFGGKVQKYVEDPNTHFYSPKENPTGDLWYTDNTLKMQTPIHVLNPGTNVAEIAQTLLTCGTCGEPDSGAPFSFCVCNAPVSVGDILCPGALISSYSYTINAQGECVSSPLWCRYLKQSIITIPQIKTSDITSNYEY